MPNYRHHATIVGVLFIVATAFLFIGEAFYKPILGAENYLELAFPEKRRIITGILLEFICVLAMPLIPVFLFPVLKRFNEPLALAYMFFRFLEAMLLIAVAEVNKLSIINLSEQYLNGGDADQIAQAGKTIQSMTYWADTTGMAYNLIFILGTVILNVLFFRTRLIPRALSVWGLLGALLLGFGGIFTEMTELHGAIAIIFILPIALQEMVMAAWLIIKGFNPSVIAELSNTKPIAP